MCFVCVVKVALPLQNFANDPALQKYLKNASPSIRAAGRKAISELNEKNDVQGKFWFEVRFFVKMMEVCYTLLRMADGTKPCMSKFFNGMLSMPAAWDAVIAAQVVETNAIEDEGFNDPEVRARLGPMKERLQDRRVYMHSPMLGAAFATDPEFRKVDLLSVDGGGVLNDFKTMCTRILIDFKDDEDPEVTIAESESLPDGGPVGRALAQLPRFKNKDWGGAAFLPSAKSMSVASWWQQYGRMDGFDEIAKVAVRCNSKIPASAGSERNWSLFGGTWFHVSRSMLCCLLFSYLVFVSFSFLCLASFLPTRHMLSVCCHKYTKTHETLTNTVLCTLMQTSWEVGTLAWALIRQRSWSSCGPT